MKTLPNPAVAEKSSNLLSAFAQFSAKSSKPAELVASRNLLRASTTMISSLNNSFTDNSRKDKVFSLYIALKEAREAQYWLRMVDKEDSTSSSPLLNSLEDIIQIISRLIKNTKRRKELEGQYR